ncbi:MAG: DUF3043 domain-containing protein [Actinomycetota bacterium]|nr:DUF3043 domain-containing protein [Actinomycetota bacterium]
MFRRRVAPASDTAGTEPAAADEAVRSGAKGRPTPKRREAERTRRERVRAPRDRKEASRRARQEARESRARTRAALLSGDERAMPPRDRGPVKAFVRDLVDARRSVAEFFLYVALGVLLVTFIRVPIVQVLGTSLWLVMVLAIVADSLVLVRRLRRELRRRFPDQVTRGAVSYALLRSLQIRRLRLPPPRVRPGAQV